MGFGYVDLSQRKNPENERKNIGINTIGLMEPHSARQWFPNFFSSLIYFCNWTVSLPNHLLEDSLQLHWRQSLYTEMSIKSWHKNHLSFNWNCIYSDSLISFGKNTCTYTTFWNRAKNDRYERAKLMPCRFSISVSEALTNTLFFCACAALGDSAKHEIKSNK